MKMFSNTTINSKYWQVVVFPTMSVYSEQKHTAVNVEWLFWSYTAIFNKNA